MFVNYKNKKIYIDEYTRDSLGLRNYRNKTVVVLGCDVDENNSIKNDCIKKEMHYFCIDIKSHPNVDIIINPMSPLPFPDKSVSQIYTNACITHNPLHWVTFNEIRRILKNGGLHFSNAPSHARFLNNQFNYTKCPVENIICNVCLNSDTCCAKFALHNRGIKDKTAMTHFTCYTGLCWI